MSDQRVLIVDGEQRTLLFLRESLVVSGLNVETTCVSSAEEALQAFSRQPYEVVISDVQLSDMSGLQLLERLRHASSCVRAILVSGQEDAPIEAMAHELGIYHFFHKPFAFDEFAGVVANALREATMEVNQQPQAENWPMQFIRHQLSTLLRDTGAQGVLLQDRGGTTIARLGDTNGFDKPWSTVATQGSVFNFAYHQGKTHDVYLADIGNGMRLSLVFDRNQPGSRIGLVLQYTRRAAHELANLSPHSGELAH